MQSDVRIKSEVANELLAAIADARSAAGFRDRALATINGLFTSGRVAWVHQQEAHWEVAGAASSLSQLPIDVAATASDEMEITRGEGWLAIPITGRGLAAEVLLLSPHDLVSLEEAEALAKLLRSGLSIATEQSTLQTRVEQLQSLLELAASWQRKRDLTELLSDMAKAAARVLRGDRASIFLWDKANSTLIGHPAMGVEGEPPSDS
jgi:GAF domain-containing protein